MDSAEPCGMLKSAGLSKHRSQAYASLLRLGTASAIGLEGIDA